MLDRISTTEAAAHLGWVVLQSSPLHVTGVAPQDIVRDAANAIHEDAAAGEADVVVPQVRSDSLKNLDTHLAIADCAACMTDGSPHQHDSQGMSSMLLGS